MVEIKTSPDAETKLVIVFKGRDIKSTMLGGVDFPVSAAVELVRQYIKMPEDDRIAALEKCIAELEANRKALREALAEDIKICNKKFSKLANHIDDIADHVDYLTDFINKRIRRGRI